MKNPVCCATLLLSIVVICGPIPVAAGKIESSPTGDRIVVDGDPSDWEDVPITYLKDSLHVSAIAHDDDNLYVMFRFADEGLARRLLMRGVTLWINGDGKAKNKKEEFAVRYPGSVQIAQQLEDRDPREERNRSETGGSETSDRGGPPPPLTGMGEVPGGLTVIRMGIAETTDENDTAGPTAASAFNEGVYCYELKVPIADIGGKIAAASPAGKRQVAIGVQIGGMTKAEMKSLQSAMREKTGGMGGTGGRGGGGMGGGPPSGMGGGGIGGMGGGMGGMGGGSGGGGMGGGGGDMRNRMDPEIEWLSVTLP